MKNLIIAALVLGTASAAMAQGYVNMKSSTSRVYLPTGEFVPASFSATLWYEDVELATRDAAFGVDKNGLANGRLAVKDQIQSDLLPANANVTLAIQAFGDIDGVHYDGKSAPFTYKTGQLGSLDPTAAADANMKFGERLTVQAVIVPEPTTIALGVLGLGGLLLFRRRD